MKRLILACLAGACLVLPPPGAAAATIATGPYTVSTTSPFVVPILVTDAVDLDSFTFDLAFDPTSFVIDTGCDPLSDSFCDFSTGPITLGTFYTSTSPFSLFNPGFVLTDATGAQTGQLVGVNGAWQDLGPAPSGDGVLVLIEFLAVDGGSPTSPITVVGSPTAPPVDATVPEPTPLVLTGSVLAGIGLRRRVSSRRGRAA